MKRALVFFFTVLALGLTVPPVARAWAQDGSNNAHQPGSVLVFPKFRVGTVLTTDQGVLPRTEFEINVVCDPDSACASGTTVAFKGHWVCRNDCQKERDFTLQATVNGTVFFYMRNPDNFAVNLPAGTPFVEEPDCFYGQDQGYLIVYAVDGNDNPIKFNGLIGAATLRGGDEHNCPTCAERYQAIPIQAVSDSTDGKLHFDGSNYKQVTDSVFGSVRYPGDTFALLPGPPQPPLTATATGSIHTTLTLLTLDVFGFGSPNNQNVNVLINFYNEGEDSHSTITSFRCYETQHIDFFSGGPDNFFGRKGLVKTAPAVFDDGSPATVLGLIEVREDVKVPPFGASVTTRWYADVLYSGGSLQSTTFEPGVDPPLITPLTAPAPTPLTAPAPTPLTAPAPTPSLPSVPGL